MRAVGRLVAVASFFLFASAGDLSARDAASLWAALRVPGHLALMRHTLAPGVGDPAGFDIARCETQRNLSASGRRDAKAIGDAFRENGIASATILTSAWCRCRETATLLALGPPREASELNSFFRSPEKGAEARLRGFLSSLPLREPTVLVTHQVNITSVLGGVPSSGEIYVVRREASGELRLLGSLPPP